MDVHDLTTFATLQEKRFKLLDGGKHTDLERTYAQLVKLGEEYGELCEAIMADVGHQRPEKLAEHEHDHIALEMADVIIVTFILAERLKVDLPDALKRKIDIIHERFKDVVIE